MGFKTLHFLSPDGSRGTKSQYTTETQKWRCSPFPQCFDVFGVLGSTVPNKLPLSFSLSHLKVEGFGRRMSTTCHVFYFCVLAFACRGGRMRTAQGCHRRDGHPGNKKKYVASGCDIDIYVETWNIQHGRDLRGWVRGLGIGVETFRGG
jgi:hypothetical protein